VLTLVVSLLVVMVGLNQPFKGLQVEKPAT